MAPDPITFTTKHVGSSFHANAGQPKVQRVAKNKRMRGDQQGIRILPSNANKLPVVKEKHVPTAGVSSSIVAPTPSTDHVKIYDIGEGVKSTMNLKPMSSIRYVMPLDDEDLIQHNDMEVIPPTPPDRIIPQ